MNSKYCRLCARLQPATDLIQISHRNLQLDYKIECCFQISVSNEDTLPKAICSNCLENVINTYQFYKKVHDAQNVLLNLCSQCKIENNSDTSLKEEDTTNFEQLYVKSESETSLNPFLAESCAKLKKDCDENLSSQCFDNDTTNLTSSDCSDQEGTDDENTSEKKISTRSQKFHQNSKKSNVYRSQIWDDFEWICTVCTERFSNRIDLSQHYKIKHYDKSPEYQCMECSKVYLNHDAFRHHIRKHRDQFKFRCEMCNKYYQYKSSYKKHLLHVHKNSGSKYDCDQCGKKYKVQSSLIAHKNVVHKLLRYECDICHKKLNSEYNLIAHKNNVHNGIKLHMCEICGLSFAQISTFQYHINSKHSSDDVQDFQCDKCTKRFKNQNLLNRHISRIHLDIKKFECETCGHKFRENSCLVQHRLLHSGELLFECEYCQKRFRLKKCLKDHIRQHTGEKPYTCEECKHDFTNSGNYYKHMKRKHSKQKLINP